MTASCVILGTTALPALDDVLPLSSWLLHAVSSKAEVIKPNPPNLENTILLFDMNPSFLGGAV
jgi:hypothetical protein